MSTPPPEPAKAEKKTKTTEIMVRESNLIHSGERNGRKWQIFQLIAQNRDGQLIDLNLRSFSELPKNQLIKVDVEKYESDRFGQSYTVSLHGKKEGGGLGKKVDDLRAELRVALARITDLEERVKRLSAGQTQTSASAPSQGPPDLSGMPSDDIPF